MSEREDPTQPIKWVLGAMSPPPGATFTCPVRQCAAIRVHTAQWRSRGGAGGAGGAGGEDLAPRSASRVDPAQAPCASQSCRLIDLRRHGATARSLGESVVWLSAHLEALWEFASEGPDGADEELAEDDFWRALEEDANAVRERLPSLLAILELVAPRKTA